jgi:hypothetical protein
MKKNKKINYIGFIILGLAVGIGIWMTKEFIIPRYFTELTDAQKAEKLIQEFKEIEVVCGKRNVSELCSEGTNGCKVITGFTCNNYRDAAHKEEIEKERKEQEEQNRRNFPEFYK